MKKALIIMNPTAGTKKANPQLSNIITAFNEADYETMVLMTLQRGRATELVQKYGPGMDEVVIIGGDGTFNEVVTGMLQCGLQLPIGYIPAGSTNDFATSLGLSKLIPKATEEIILGRPFTYDVGKFGDRYFSYVASFGAFTKASYATPQNVKNALGHLAYVLSGIAEIGNLPSWHCKFLLDNRREVEGDYIFGAISNSTSVAGILTLDPEVVDLNDGILELLLVKYPKDLGELSECIRALTSQDYDSPMLEFRSASVIDVTADPAMDWTLDGEFAQGAEKIHVQNLHNAISILQLGRKKN